jgi:hypothetical protein
VEARALWAALPRLEEEGKAEWRAGLRAKLQVRSR